jgi:hypothetical protein
MHASAISTIWIGLGIVIPAHASNAKIAQITTHAIATLSSKPTSPPIAIADRIVINMVVLVLVVVVGELALAQSFDVGCSKVLTGIQWSGIRRTLWLSMLAV